MASLVEPEDTPSDDHRCVAIAGPRVISRQQQELVCLRSAHLDCPRYRRGVVSPEPDHAPARPPLPRAVGVSLIVLALSAGISLGFVLQRGGIDLPASPAPSLAAAVPSTSEGGSSATQVPSPSAEATAPPSVVPSAVPTKTSAPTQAPVATPAPTPKPTPKPTPRPSVRPTPVPSVAPSPSAAGVPSASRLAVLTLCPDRTGCYVYRIRSGDNLTSIAHWFGVPLATIYAWNPTLRTTSIQPGDRIRIPTPTR